MCNAFEFSFSFHFAFYKHALSVETFILYNQSMSVSMIYTFPIAETLMKVIHLFLLLRQVKMSALKEAYGDKLFSLNINKYLT